MSQGATVCLLLLFIITLFPQTVTAVSSGEVGGLLKEHYDDGS